MIITIAGIPVHSQ